MMVQSVYACNCISCCEPILSWTIATFCHVCHHSMLGALFLALNTSSRQLDKIFLLFHSFFPINCIHADKYLDSYKFVPVALEASDVLGAQSLHFFKDLGCHLWSATEQLNSVLCTIGQLDGHDFSANCTNCYCSFCYLLHDSTHNHSSLLTYVNT